MSLIMGKTSPPSALLTIFLYIIIIKIGTFIIQLFYIDFQKLAFIRGDSAPTTRPVASMRQVRRLPACAPLNLEKSEAKTFVASLTKTAPFDENELK